MSERRPTARGFGLLLGLATLGLACGRDGEAAAPRSISGTEESVVARRERGAPRAESGGVDARRILVRHRLESMSREALWRLGVRELRWTPADPPPDVTREQLLRWFVEDAWIDGLIAPEDAARLQR